MTKLFNLFSVMMLLSAASNAQAWQTGISVHDPVMIRQDSLYYVFCTGRGIAMWSSPDRVHWKRETQVFSAAPPWTADVVPGFKNGEWAPDISYYNGSYYLYYAVSAFGKNTSAIGVATNTTLHTDDPAYQWVDHGMVIQSVPGKTNWNAIDPNLITDKDGTPYLVFGSFWGGLKIIRLTKDRLHPDQPLADMPTLASRETNPNAIEAPFIFSKGKYFYLFASIDYCCKGPLSNYKMIVGRAKKLLGPYVDSKGSEMKSGGGDLLLAGDKDWYGVGHNAVCDFDGTDYLVFHGYDAADNGKSKLRIEKLIWKNGWPTVANSQAAHK
jgi:arabinan endo-1,5-alpha-L-arabinosidase